MWIQISKCDNKLYQNGKVVKEIKLSGNTILDIEVRSPGVIWVKIGD